MRVALTDDQFRELLASFANSAFRLEMQPAYEVTYERDIIERFLDGHPEPPTECEGLRAWFEQVERQIAQGKTVERVRIFDEPPTDYQRWERSIDPWNTAAGEVIRYLTRSQAYRVGLLPAAGDSDWWLFDDNRLMIMSYNGSGRRIHTELTDEEAVVQQARIWRDLAIDTARSTAA